LEFSNFQSVRFLGRLARQYRERLTPRGRYLLWLMAALALLGLDTLSSQIYSLFAVVAAMGIVAAVHAFFPRPHVRIESRLPLRATALTPITVKAVVVNESKEYYSGLQFCFPLPSGSGGKVIFQPRENYFSLPPGKSAELAAEFQALKRGRYLLPGSSVRSTDPLRLATTRAAAADEQILFVYPRYYSMEEFTVPLGRRYQPGGIPLSSSTGDAIEFVGTREYREGDPVKNIHWKSWARRGEPVVKEFEEEYFCRIAIILDTFLPAHPGPAALAAFESAISVVASIADYFSRGEYIVDILAAGPDIYQVSAGRSLAYLENILDVLSCLDPCSQPPFESIGPALHEKLAQITTVVAVLLDWDEQRENFLRGVKSLGTSVRAIVVHEGETQKPWQHAGGELDEVSHLTPADVERSLAAARKIPGVAAPAGGVES
jgi:uncharacterized protein (DUF58 family)